MTAQTQAAHRSHLPHPTARHLLLVAFAALIAGLASMAQDLSYEGRITLTVSGLAILGWVGTRIAESLVALGAAVALVLSGVLSEAQLFEALGNELVWLLLAAFIIAAVAKEAGLTQRLIAPVLRRGLPVAPLFLALTLAIAATAFVLPSTSGRAALLLPVFAAMAAALPDRRLVRPLALLFPTVILLSAGGSLIGAGAHLLAAHAIHDTTGISIGYLDWALLAMPFSLLVSLIGAGLILVLFVPRTAWMARLPQIEPTGFTPAERHRQMRISGVLLAVVGLWLTSALHGMGMGLVALIGAMVLLTRPFNLKKTKEICRAIDTELLLYMAATMLIAEAMIASGTDRWLAGHALDLLPASMASNRGAVVVLISAVSVLAHLAITSRSARAAVLIPAVALPLAGLGHDAALMILIAVMGSGFCQSMMASAKPVAIFGNAEEAGFAQSDLTRLALPLAAVVTALLIGFALWVWPHQLERLVTAPQPAPPPVVTERVSVPLPPISQLFVLPPGITDARPLPRPEGLGIKVTRQIPIAPQTRRIAPNRTPPAVNQLLRHVGIRLVIR